MQSREEFLGNMGSAWRTSAWVSGWTMPPLPSLPIASGMPVESRKEGMLP